MSKEDGNTVASNAAAWVQAALSQGLSPAALLDALEDVSVAPDPTRPPRSPRATTTIDWRPMSDDITDTGVRPPRPAAALRRLPDPMRYEDCGSLGRGGMGEVRRVRDRQLRRTLALKVLRAQVSRQPELAARFLSEAQAIAQLQHPGIIPIYDQGVLEDGRLWFTMKEVSGDTLAEVIRQLHAVSAQRWSTTPSGWTLRRTVDALVRVCEAVAYAHERGVLHRDLKPSNIMAGAHGEVLVLDWGLAKVWMRAPEGAQSPGFEPVQTERSISAAHDTLDGQIAGTPAYMSPEQARGAVDKLDMRSDVYSLGATLYEVLAGHPPYVEANAREVLKAVLKGPPRPLTTGNPLLQSIGLVSESSPQASPGPPRPPALVRACERAMKRRPEERFPSVRALGEALRAWLEGAQKREDALAVVESARGWAVQVQELRAQAAERRGAAAQKISRVESWQPESEKLAAWALEDEADAFDRQADLAELREEQLLHASLTHTPDLTEAHAALAARYRVQHQTAEAERRDAARAQRLLQQHLMALPAEHSERLDHEAYLAGVGALSLVTDPPGAEVLLYRYVEETRRVVCRFERSLGRTPLKAVELQMGSYLCVLRHPECSDVHYPVLIERQQHWDGVPPEGGDATPIPLPRRGTLGPDDQYVPAGWFWCGGPTVQPRVLPRQRIWVDGRVFRRFPVTNADYICFLDDLVKQGRLDEALQHAPRERAGTVGESGALIFGFDGARFSLRPDADGDVWEPDVPVYMVDWYGASAFAAWEAERTGQPWRLPDELAWEKAARGVDGRLYPWGDRFDASWVCMRDSHEGRMLPASIHAHPVDESPYGIRGMAGNACDWCIDRHREDPGLTGARVLEPPQDPSVPAVCQTRGGGWYSEARDIEVIQRYWNVPSTRSISLGFRLARTWTGT